MIVEAILWENKILLKNNKVAIDKNCCCDCPDECFCGQTLTTNLSNARQVKVTLGNGAIQYYCFNQLPKLGGGYVETMTCNGCNYDLVFNTGTCSCTVKVKISNPNECDCNNTDYCEVELISWTNEEGCPQAASVVNLELLDLCA